MSATAGQKRRPPPIAVPPLPPQRVVPGPNAFAIAAMEQQQQAAHASQPQKYPSTNTTPLTSPVEASASGSAVGRSGSQTSKSRSSKNAFSSLLENARGSLSPRKSDRPPTTPTSRRNSTTRSRHSQRSSQSAASAYAHVERLLAEDDEKTARGEMEAQTEKKLFKMMGQVPATPISDGSGNAGFQIVTNDLRGRKKLYGTPDSNKSPKKKIFGMSLPGFRASGGASIGGTLTPQPQIPTKASQVLGTSLSRKPHRHVPRPIGMPRSESSKSLPPKVYEQPRSHGRRPSPRNRPANRRPSIKDISLIKKQTSSQSGVSSSDLGAPPTPPRKDSPRAGGGKTDEPKTALRRVAHAGKIHEMYAQAMNSETVPRLASSNLSAGAVPTQGGKSPTKFLPYAPEEYAKLIEGDHIASAHAEVGFVTDYQQGIHSAPLEKPDSKVVEQQHPERWSEGDQTQRPSKPGNQAYGCLPPRFYSPSNYPLGLFENGTTPSKNSDKERFLFTVPKVAYVCENPSGSSVHKKTSSQSSIAILFQGSANEIDPSSRTGRAIRANMGEEIASHQEIESANAPSRALQDLHINEPQEMALRGGGSGISSCMTGYLPLGSSSSRLTEILSNISPTKVGFNGDFHPSHPSAVPSPLRRGHNQQLDQQPPPMPGPPFVGDSPFPIDMDTHFHLTNEHLDITAHAICSLVETCHKDQSAKREQSVGYQEEKFEDIKSRMSTISQKADHASEQNHNINLKLENLLDVIKAEVIAPLANQAKKAEAMEHNFQELRKMVQDLQNTIETKVGSATTVPGTLAPGNSTYSSQHTAPLNALPIQRSQPSLTNYYNPSNDNGRGGQQGIPAMPDIRSDARFRYGNHYGSNNWARPPYVGRDGKEDISPTNTDPYSTISTGQYGAPYMGGVPGYSFASNQREQHYNYNAGPSK